MSRQLSSIFVMAGLFLSSAAHAQDNAECSDEPYARPSADKNGKECEAVKERSRRVVSLVSENDLFGGTDQNYTNGMRIELYAEADDTHPIFSAMDDLVPFIDLEQSSLWQGFGLAHAMYTPEDIEARIPDPKDRPYAGWLYASGSIVASSNTHQHQHAIQVNLGMIGPAAGAGWVQDEYHSLIQERDPQGWDSQLKNELGFELLAQRTRRIRSVKLGPLEYDSSYHYGLTLGNVHTNAFAGGMIRLGNDLNSDWGPPRIRPAVGGAGTFSPEGGLGGYLFLGVESRYVYRNIFLDGNTFVDSARVTGRRRWVGDLQGGLALNAGGVQVAFTYVHRTEQFEYQESADRFGAVSLSVAY